LFRNKGCPDRTSSPATLGVSNMLGVFLLVASGIFAGFFLLSIEIAFKRRKEKQQKEIELSRHALIHWRRSVEVNKSHQYILLFVDFFRTIILIFRFRNIENIR